MDRGRVHRVTDEMERDLAAANRCTHGDALLCDGFLEGHEIECPHHQGRFDVRTGAATAAPAEVALATWPARVVDGRIELLIA